MTDELELLTQQDYPLSVTKAEADELVACIRRIMECVPNDDRVLVRGDYNAVTTALSHPTGGGGPRTNERVDPLPFNPDFNPYTE